VIVDFSSKLQRRKSQKMKLQRQKPRRVKKEKRLL
jgi:hypothetical protein